MNYKNEVLRRMRIRKIQAQQRRFKRNVFMLVISILVISCLFCGVFGTTITDSQYITVRVKSGDTLWSIAKDHYEGDIRNGIIKIKKANGLKTSDIEVSQIIKIPVE